MCAQPRTAGQASLVDACQWAMAPITNVLLRFPPSAYPPSSAGSSEMFVVSMGVICQTLPIFRILATLQLHICLVQLLLWEVAACTFTTIDTFSKLRIRR
jgi:hypothetical protein